MANELNELTYNNTPITFTGKTDNIATSDETKAPLLYQDKMGTVYSKSKAVRRAFNFAGISLILTAVAIKTGSLISNVYILNPPTAVTILHIKVTSLVVPSCQQYPSLSETVAVYSPISVAAFPVICIFVLLNPSN